VRGVLYGAIYSTLLTQTMKSVIILAMNLVFGVPLAAPLAVVSFIIGFFPIVGSWSVYVPVAEIYNPTPGGLHAVDLATGARAWFAPPADPLPCGRLSRSCSGAQFSAVTVIPGVVLSPSNDGAVRAYSTTDGTVLWQFDTNRDFTTVNGVKARGGSMSGPAPVVAGGVLYISSGYGAFGLRAGNVLLAFGAD